MPLKWSNPAIGTKWSMAKVEEVKIEFMCEKEKVKDIVKAIKETHPYESIAINVIQLIDFD